MTEENTTAIIRKLNDEFRNKFWCSPLGKTVLTRGVQVLPPKDKSELMNKIRFFNDFNEDNDPYGEHDFGKIEISGETVFWKIDYYDSDFQYGSPDPSDPNVTQRLLTIMMAEEY